VRAAFEQVLVAAASGRPVGHGKRLLHLGQNVVVGSPDRSWTTRSSATSGSVTGRNALELPVVVASSRLVPLSGAVAREHITTAGLV
jgi:hypothetical protein